MSSDSGPAARPYGRRADAERNRESVIDHAARLLSDDPGIGMGEIATASGIGRATIYRHFPTRELLIEAIVQRALNDAELAIQASRLEEGTPTEALHRLIATLMDLAARYRFLFSESGVMAPSEYLRLRTERLSAPVTQLLERGQASGEFSRSLSPAFMQTAMGAVLVAAVGEMALVQMTADVEAVTRLITHGISATGD